MNGFRRRKELEKLISKNKIKSEVLAASIRNHRELREVALIGVDIATMPFSLLKELVRHDKTIEGMKGFTKDVVKEYQKISMK